MIYRARYVLPMDGRVIRDGEVVVREGGIVAVGQGLAEAYPEDAISDLGDCALLPGFVNAHSHLDPTFRRNLGDGLNLWDWLDALAFRKGTVPDYDILLASATLGAAECARSGITCLGDSTISGAAAEAMAAVGLRGVVYRELFGQSMGAEYRSKFASVMDQVRELRERFGTLLKIGLSPHSVYTSTPEVLGLCAETCTEFGIRVAIHLAETSAEAEYLQSGTGPLADWRRGLGYEPMVAGVRPARLLERVGLLRPGVCLAHCAHLSEDEVDLVAGSGASVAHCPRSNAYLGAGVAPVLRLRNAGAVVGVGTDSAGSAMTLDMFEEMRFGLGLQRAISEDAGVITAKVALEMATIDGARALGLAELVGTLEPGKRADMIALDVSDALAGEDVYLAVVSRSPGDVRLAMVEGREVALGGRAVSVDIAGCRARLDEVYGRG